MTERDEDLLAVRPPWYALRCALAGHQLIRPESVQSDTVRCVYHQDSIRSSHGWAPAGRKAIGFSTVRRCRSVVLWMGAVPSE